MLILLYLSSCLPIRRPKEIDDRFLANSEYEQYIIRTLDSI